MGREEERSTTEMPVADLSDLLVRSARPDLPAALGPCVLLHHLADGPSCAVYLGTSGKLDEHQRLCVVKRVNDPLAAQQGFAERFAAATRRLVYLDHRNVAQVFDAGMVDGSYYLAREHALGCRLDELLGARAGAGWRLPLDLALYIAADVLRALYHALRQAGPDGAPLGLWHGRLRPRSVLLSTDGVVKVIGFDREWEPFPVDTNDSGFLATVEERNLSAQDGMRHDVFAAGCLLQTLLDEPLEAAELAPDLEGAAVGVATLIARATSADPSHRPRDVGALLRPVRAALHQVNPRCGPMQLAAHLRRVMPEALLARAAVVESLRDRDVAAVRAVSEQSTRRTQILLEGADEAARDRAVERAQAKARAANLTGPLYGTKYRILRPVGEGGMGTVFAAEHVDLEKVFALKVLHRTSGEGAKERDKLRREARAASKLRHPNIVNVSDFGETPDGRVFFVMEYLEGASLGEILASEEVIEQARLVSILIQVCDGLHAAHKSGVVHRDIKPDNIFLVREDGTETVKVLDFGVAVVGTPSAEKRRRVAGTPPYMSPEMILLQPIDGRSDLYSLGVVAYECLTGQRPFARVSLRELLRRHVEVSPDPLRGHAVARGVHPALETTVMRALRKKPWERFPDAQAMGDELRIVRELLRAQARESLLPSHVIQRSESVQKEIDAAWSKAVDDFQARAPEAEGEPPGLDREREE